MLVKVRDAGDLMLAVMCALGNHTKDTTSSFESILGTSRPIYYLNEETRLARHSVWQDIVKKDEEKYVTPTVYDYKEDKGRGGEEKKKMTELL